MPAQLLKIKIRAICLTHIVLSSAIVSSHSDCQEADKFLLLSSACLSHLTDLGQSIPASERGSGMKPRVSALECKSKACWWEEALWNYTFIPIAVQFVLSASYPTNIWDPNKNESTPKHSSDQECCFLFLSVSEMLWEWGISSASTFLAILLDKYLLNVHVLSWWKNLSFWFYADF